MTNVQAIDLLKGLEQSLDDYCGLNDKGRTAFRMAITALEVFGHSEQLPSAQPEQNNDSEFWRKRADYYSDTCMKLIGEIGKGIKVVSVNISENGIEFITEQPSAQLERKRGKWTSENTCEFCGFQPWYERDIHTLSFCPNCGADMRGGPDV